MCKGNRIPQKKWPFHHLFVTREGIYGRLALLHHHAVRKGMGGGLLGRPYFCRIRVLFLHHPPHTSASKASTQCMRIFLYTGWYVHTVWSVVRMNVDLRRAQPAWRLTIRVDTVASSYHCLLQVDYVFLWLSPPHLVKHQEREKEEKKCFACREAVWVWSAGDSDVHSSIPSSC